MRLASNMYISKSTPRSKPIVFSERANRNVGRIHTISGKAVQVTTQATGLVHEAIERAVDYVAAGDKKKERGKGNPVSNKDGSPAKLSLKTRLLMSTDMVLTTLEQSTKELIERGTDRLSQAMEHKLVSLCLSSAQCLIFNVFLLLDTVTIWATRPVPLAIRHGTLV